MKTLALLAFLGACTLLAAGCAPPPPPAGVARTTGAGPAVVQAPVPAQTTAQAITITATEMAFSPGSLEVKAGQPVTLTVRNNGVVEHNWQANIGNETVLITAQPKQSASKTFTPQTPGTYKVICSVPGHEQAGMVATLVVK